MISILADGAELLGALSAPQKNASKNGPFFLFAFSFWATVATALPTPKMPHCFSQTIGEHIIQISKFARGTCFPDTSVLPKNVIIFFIKVP